MNLTDKYILSKEVKQSLPAQEHIARWQELCKVYLPSKEDGIFWRFNRLTKPGEPTQGWKLHVSALVAEACDLFEKVAPFLVSLNVRFKAPESLQELIKINSGLSYGYCQIGKFLTIYSSTEMEAIELARELHELTHEFVSISVPFDNQYRPNSCVFYRYGAFDKIEMKTEDGLSLPAVRDSGGKLVYDDRLQAVPEWMNDPFQNLTDVAEKDAEIVETPLMTTYKVFRAIRQRGKGGTYHALDLSTNQPRFCVVKEGRRYGEFFWNGQDGYRLVQNEQKVLSELGKIYKGVPEVFSWFEAEGNFYLVMEFVDGESLFKMLKTRQRRFSIRQIIVYSVGIARILEEIHKAGWIWNDCKPANLIVTQNKSLRPIDFEGAYRIGETAPFNWESRGFSKPLAAQSSADNNDFYALGAVIYFLLTGQYYKPDIETPIEKLRRNIPRELKEIVMKLLTDIHSNKNSATKIRRRLTELLNSI